MKRTAKTISFVLVVSFIVMAYSPHISAMEDSSRTNSENYCRTKSLVDSGILYDIGLYSDVTLAMEMLKNKSKEFEELCSERETVLTLLELIRLEKDSFPKYLLITWYEYLRGGTLAPGASSVFPCAPSGYQDYSLRLPSGKTIAALKYIGSQTPEEYPHESKFPSANRVGPPSFYYNCHAYAWYYGGNVSCLPQSELLVVNWVYPYFTTDPTCATKVTIPSPGDIVIYKGCQCPSKNGRVTHSGIIVSVSGGESNRIVRSKWGYYGTYIHKLYDCPYYDPPHPAEDNPHILCPGGTVEYYRLSHDFRSYEYLNPAYHRANCYNCGKKTLPHYFFFSGGRYICSDCGYSTTEPVFPQGSEIDER
jgi:hypothetical protein